MMENAENMCQFNNARSSQKFLSYYIFRVIEHMAGDVLLMRSTTLICIFYDFLNLPSVGWLGPVQIDRRFRDAYSPPD